MAHGTQYIEDRPYVFDPRWRIASIVLMVIGLLGLVYGLVVYTGEQSHRFWANMLVDSTFFLGIAMASAFFISSHYLAWGGWFIAFKRVPEAIMGYLPFGAVILLIVLIFGQHDLYHWAQPGISDPHSNNYDPVIAGKSPYLNNPFFFIRFFVFLGGLVFVAFQIRKTSLREDTLAAGDTSAHKRLLVLASIFLPIFAVYILVTAWDWLMSIDTYWFSTMYGWYVFASFWVTGISVITLVILSLKRMGYLPNVNANHLQDLGKYMFAFSIFWTYVTFDQYMLIWYANLPEETVYFMHRYENYSFLFYSVFILNFVAPFLVLMSRDAKRHATYLTVAAVIIIVGHFIDFFLMVMPGVVKADWGFGPMELLLPCLFIGMILFITHTRLANAPLTPKNSPLIQESLQHEI